MNSSRKVTSPGFSIAPRLYSGTNAWSYFPEGVRVVEVVVEEVQALLGDQEDVVGVEVRCQALAAQGAERDLQPRTVIEDALVGVRHVVVGTGDDARDVRRDRLRLREPPDPVGAFAGAVAPHRPLLGRPHLKRKGAFRSGCSKLAKTRRGVGRFVLGVEVDLAVLGVDEAVQALTGAGVGALGVDDQLVVGGQVLQGDPGAVEDLARVEVAAVEGDRGDARCDQVGGAARAPGSLQRKRTVVTDRKVRGPSPSAAPVAERTSRDTSYPSTESRAARSGPRRGTDSHRARAALPRVVFSMRTAPILPCGPDTRQPGTAARAGNGRSGGRGCLEKRSVAPHEEETCRRRRPSTSGSTRCAPGPG